MNQQNRQLDLVNPVSFYQFQVNSQSQPIQNRVQALKRSSSIVLLSAITIGEGEVKK